MCDESVNEVIYFLTQQWVFASCVDVGQTTQFTDLVASRDVSLIMWIASITKGLLTGELYRKSLLADEIIRIKLQCEYVEGRVDIFR